VFKQSNSRLRNFQVLNNKGEIIEVVQTTTEAKPNNGNMYRINHKNQPVSLSINVMGHAVNE
jgi:hypothetical protein